MKTRRAEASSPNSDPQFFWNEYLQKWTDLRAACIAETQLPLCQEKPSMEIFKNDRITKLNIDLRADLLKTWSEQEKELFTQRFIEVGKDFPLIADVLPGKTVAQCIQYYYLTKHRFCYKMLRKKAMDEENAAKTRRAKSCGNGKGTKRPLELLGNADEFTKVKLRKTFSCPEPNTLKSKEMSGDNKSKANEGGHSSQHMEQINGNASGSTVHKHETIPSKQTRTGISKDSVNKRKRKSAKGVKRRKGFTKISTTPDELPDSISECMNNQETSDRITKAAGQTTSRIDVAKRLNDDHSNDGEVISKEKDSTNLSTTSDQWPDSIYECMKNQETSERIIKVAGQTTRRIAPKRPNDDHSNDGKVVNKKKCLEANNNGSTDGVFPITEVQSTLGQSSNIKKMGNVHTGNSQAKVRSAKAQASRSNLFNADRKTKRKDTRKRTTKIIDNGNHGSHEKVPTGTPSIDTKGVIQDPSVCGNSSKRSRIEDIGVNNPERKCFKKLKNKTFDKRLFVKFDSKVATKASTEDNKIKGIRTEITNTPKRSVEVNCDAPKGKSIVKEVNDPGDHEHDRSTDGGKMKKSKQKRPRLDVEMSSKRQRKMKETKKDADGNSSGCGNELSEDYGERNSRKRNSNISQGTPVGARRGP